MAPIDAKQEEQILEQFRSAVSDLGRDDATLRRFLRARDHDLTKAEEMLRKSMKWREENSMDYHKQWKLSEVVINSFPFGTYGRDNEKRLVYYFPVGKWEVRKMITAGHGEDMLRYMLDLKGPTINQIWIKNRRTFNEPFPQIMGVFYFYLLFKQLALAHDVRERLIECLEILVSKYFFCIKYSMDHIIGIIDESGNDNFSLIIDLEDLTYWKVAHYETMQMVLKVFRDFEANYPERLGEAFVINAPWVLNTIFPLIKPLLHSRTMAKVSFLGSDSTKFVPQLMERMPPEAMSPKLCNIMKTLRNNNAYA